MTLSVVWVWAVGEDEEEDRGVRRGDAGARVVEYGVGAVGGGR